MQILRKPATSLWANAGDAVKTVSYPCVLLQCSDCGHVYEPMTPELDQLLRDVYQSEHAQASTSLGHGDWGMSRTQRLFDHFDIGQYTSALDIGCADGYLLRALRMRGVKTLTGIEPSLDASSVADGIMLIKGFAHRDFQLSQPYEMIFASNLLEHVEDINGLMDFCSRHLQPLGKLFFTVPNAERALSDGDPGLFLHQHLHHFTTASLKALCRRHGLTMTALTTTPDLFFVTAAAFNTDKNSTTALPLHSYFAYEERLDAVLAYVRRHLAHGRVIVHGANNALHNMLSWLGTPFEFTLADNDSTKHKKLFFHQRVHAVDEIDLDAHDKVLVVPTAFFDTIKEDYLRRAFKGTIVSIIPDHEYVS